MHERVDGQEVRGGADGRFFRTGRVAQVPAIWAVGFPGPIADRVLHAARTSTRDRSRPARRCSRRIVLTPSVTTESVARSENLLAIGRFGVGSTRSTWPPVGRRRRRVHHGGVVDRSVAEATVGWMIALTHHLRIKDQLVRTVNGTTARGTWAASSRSSDGRDRVGGIARATLELLRGFGMRPPLACDPLIRRRRPHDWACAW